MVLHLLFRQWRHQGEAKRYCLLLRIRLLISLLAV